MRIQANKTYYVAKRQPDKTYGAPIPVTGFLGDATAKVMSSIHVDTHSTQLNTTRKVLNLPLSYDEFDLQDRLYLTMPLDADILGTSAEYEIIGAMRGLRYVSYLLGKRQL